MISNGFPFIFFQYLIHSKVMRPRLWTGFRRANRVHSIFRWHRILMAPYKVQMQWMRLSSHQLMLSTWNPCMYWKCSKININELFHLVLSPPSISIRVLEISVDKSSLLPSLRQFGEIVRIKVYFANKEYVYDLVHVAACRSSHTLFLNIVLFLLGRWKWPKGSWTIRMTPQWCHRQRHKIEKWASSIRLSRAMVRCHRPLISMAMHLSSTMNI